jgi:hypothetical protein
MRINQVGYDLVWLSVLTRKSLTLTRGIRPYALYHLTAWRPFLTSQSSHSRSQFFTWEWSRRHEMQGIDTAE